MVHHRVNEREPNPNPHVNFITPLPAAGEREQEEARQLLRALAAQVRPVMKAHGFTVNSLEEYEYNRVFAGRNWNNGEVVELVLRKLDGSFVSTSYLISTLCHELAHILYMNHGPAFQALWSKLRHEVRALQMKGYYGDGYWSSGTRLVDSTRVNGESADTGDFPEYMCGGAQARARPTRPGRRPRHPRRPLVPSYHTGAQTAKKRKAGARVRSAGVFIGEGQTVGVGEEGTGFGKSARSKRAREERAIAAEKRMLALQTQSAGPSSLHSRMDDDTSDSESEEERVAETDQDRRHAMNEEDLDPTNKNTSWGGFEDDFKFPSLDSSRTGEEVILISDSESQVDASCDLSAKGKIGSAFAVAGAIKSSGKGKAHEPDGRSCRPVKRLKNSKTPATTSPSAGNLLRSEIRLWEQESLGLASKNGGRKLNGSLAERTSKWECMACTLLNEPLHLACDACGTPQGEVLQVDSENI